MPGKKRGEIAAQLLDASAHKAMEDADLVARKFDLLASIKELEAESARLNVELNDRGITNQGQACW